MWKLASFICVTLVSLLQIQLAFSQYSNSCNSTALIQNGEEVGIRGGRIPDLQLTASSFSDDKHSPGRGRLEQVASGNQASCWCSKIKDSKQWIMVHFVEPRELTAIATQGQFDPEGQKPNVTYKQSWVTEYQVEYSHDNKTFNPIEYKAENPLVFKGNSDGNSTTCNKFPYSIKTKYIRVRPTKWQEKICLRIGLFGKPVPANFTFGFNLLEDERPDFYIMWWWILFWAILGVLLLILLTVLILYCCRTRYRTYAHEKVLKEKPPKPTIQRRTDSSFVNEAYDMTVMTSKTSIPDTPSSMGDPGDEVQEVTAEFTADEQENQKGIVGFSVTDDKDSSDEETANGDVNWEKYKQKALQRPKHTYENVEIKHPPRD